MSEQEKTPVEVIELAPVWEVMLSPNWTGKLIEALAKAQLKFKAVVKQTDNAAFMRGGKASKYADLAEYIDATQGPLAENGLVVTQWPDVSPEAKSMSLVSFLMHSSGEWMRGKLTLPAIGRDGFTAQSCGSSITYARRYSYAAITGVASEDDDGNAASGRGTAEAAQAVGKEKVAKLKEKMATEGSNGHGELSDGASLFYALQPSGQYAIAGDKDLMKKLWPQFKNSWQQHAEAYMVNEEGLEQIRFQCEQGHIPFALLKGPKS